MRKRELIYVTLWEVDENFITGSDGYLDNIEIKIKLVAF